MNNNQCSQALAINGETILLRVIPVNCSCYCPHQVERNVLDVSYHVSQYRTIISELREEIARLRAKMKEDRPRSGDTSNDKAEKLKLLRDKIVSTFREQMRLRSASCDVVGAL
jgi:hypothetical protein